MAERPPGGCTGLVTDVPRGGVAQAEEARAVEQRRELAVGLEVALAAEALAEVHRMQAVTDWR